MAIFDTHCQRPLAGNNVNHVMGDVYSYNCVTASFLCTWSSATEDVWLNCFFLLLFTETVRMTYKRWPVCQVWPGTASTHYARPWNPWYRTASSVSLYLASPVNYQRWAANFIKVHDYINVLKLYCQVI